MATKQSVVKAWETKLGIKNEFHVEEVENKSTGEKGFNLISRNGSLSAAAPTLEQLEANAGAPFVEPTVDLSVAADPVEIDNSKPGGHDEPTTEESERLRKGVTKEGEHSGNDVHGETEKQAEQKKAQEEKAAREKEAKEKAAAEKEVADRKAKEKADAEKAEADKKAKEDAAKNGSGQGQ